MSKVEVVLGGVKAVYDGGPYITLVDRLTNKPYDVIHVWDCEADAPRIDMTERDVWEELDRVVHYEQHGRGNPKNYR